MILVGAISVETLGTRDIREEWEKQFGRIYIHPILEVYETVGVLDGTDTPISLDKCNSSETLNLAVQSPFRHKTWPASVCIRNNTLSKLIKYTPTMTSVKLLEPRFLQLLNLQTA